MLTSRYQRCRPQRDQERAVLCELLDEMERRLEDTQLNLEHQQETSEVIIRQLENLLSLVRESASRPALCQAATAAAYWRPANSRATWQAFNTQAIAQGQAMATLNILATVFLPLSFVAVGPPLHTYTRIHRSHGGLADRNLCMHINRAYSA